MADEDGLDAFLEPHESADAPAERHELHHELLAALATLPVEQQAALVLVDMQGYPVAEAAAVLDVPEGTVKSRCARGRARLLPLLAHLRAGGPDRAGLPGSDRRNHARGTSVPPARAERARTEPARAEQDGGDRR
jgi:RNA polymerase sigma-70 factor (ECF subfamily)